MLPCESNPKDREELKSALYHCEKRCRKFHNCDEVLKLYDRLYETYAIDEVIQ